MLKSRLNAATFEDHNTTFFHVSTLVRHHRNKIRCIKDPLGNWISYENEIKEHIRGGFEKLYTTDLILSFLSSSISTFSCCYLFHRIHTNIGRAVMNEKIRSSLWAMKPFTAPSPDGLHTGFFQHFWIEAGKSVYTLRGCLL